MLQRFYRWNSTASRTSKKSNVFHVERLEDRLLLATFIVTNLEDSGTGSLRAAIIDANTNNNPDIVDKIEFDSSLIGGTVELDTSLNTIIESVWIDGPVDQDPSGITIDGKGRVGVRPFRVDIQDPVMFSNLTVTGGNANSDGGGIRATNSDVTLNYVMITGNQTFGSASGGGYYGYFKTTINDSWIIDNHSENSGGGIDFGGGDLTISDTTIAENTSAVNAGGLRIHQSLSNIERTTFHSNVASGQGGAILIESGSGTNLRNSTLHGNQALGGAGGGGLFHNSLGPTNVINTTIVGNIDASGSGQSAGGIQIGAVPFVNLYNSVVAENISLFFLGEPNVRTGDLNVNVGSFIDGDPHLGPLQDNGGSTWTMKPVGGSPIIDIGSFGNATTNGQFGSPLLTTDQRFTGFNRFIDGDRDFLAQVDAGAYEFAPSNEPMKFFVVDKTTLEFFDYDAEGIWINTYDLSENNVRPFGATSNLSGTSRWVTNSKKVFKYSASGFELGSWFARGTTKIRGIATDGVGFWAVDVESDQVYFYADGANRIAGGLDPTSTFSLAAGNDNPQGMTTDGVHLWVVDDDPGYVKDAIYKYDLAGNLVASWRMGIENRRATGITLDPTGNSDSLWIVDKRTDEVFEYENGVNVSFGVKNASSIFELNALNEFAEGIADPSFAIPGEASKLLIDDSIQNQDYFVEQTLADGTRRFDDHFVDQQESSNSRFEQAVHGSTKTDEIVINPGVLFMERSNQIFVYQQVENDSELDFFDDDSKWIDDASNTSDAVDRFSEKYRHFN